MKLLILSFTLLIPGIALSETSKAKTEEKPEVFRSFPADTERRLDQMEMRDQQLEQQRMEEAPEKPRKDLKERQKSQDVNTINLDP